MSSRTSTKRSIFAMDIQPRARGPQVASEDPCAMLHNGLQGRFARKKHMRQISDCPIPHRPFESSSLWPPLPKYAGHIPRMADMTGTSAANFIRNSVDSFTTGSRSALSPSLKSSLSVTTPIGMSERSPTAAASALGGAVTADDLLHVSHTALSPYHDTGLSPKTALVTNAAGVLAWRKHAVAPLAPRHPPGIPAEMGEADINWITKNLRSLPCRRWSPFDNIAKYQGHIPLSPKVSTVFTKSRS